MTAGVRNWRAALSGAICAAVLTGAGLTGCGGSSPEPEEEVNELVSQPAEVIEERAMEAALAADAVRLTGDIITEGRKFRIDMRLGPDGGIGEVSTQGMNFELLRVGEDLFLKADGAFWQHQWEDGDEEAEAGIDPSGTLEGKYVKVAPDDPVYGTLSGFTEKNTMIPLLITMEGERSTGERGEIDGIETIGVLAGEGAGGVLDVALVGDPYPLRFARAGEAGQLSLLDWDQEFTLRAPKEEDILDYGDKMILPPEEESGGEGGEGEG
ncbi:hypothetical protein GCM10027160_49420 [Streptomyces calidiresistens]|uniref:Lipoprotein n=1 Tax=Streptomyces calidiresistens TaxID=1485586 RepID=A0A7W3XX56_9ACTN|nr:hypothetical protein [Streptomyces calidiresistens]MBB0230574.1 hypothetical protein [Streptomyces calidiresistens]